MKRLSDHLHNKKGKEIWSGIVRRAQQDGDYSLDRLSGERTLTLQRTRWAIGIASTILLAIGLLVFNYTRHQNKYLSHKQLEQIFADTASVSRLALSTGETILLNDSSQLDESIAHLQNGKSLDFRKLTDDVLLGEIQTLETGRGKQLHIILSDGTGVWLNASSRIAFPANFTGQERLVQAEGEVYFEVAPNKNAPFIVKTAAHQIKVLGTHFNIKHYQEERYCSVTLLEGSVEITKGGDTAEGGRRLLLKPGQQVVQQHVENTMSIQWLTNPESSIAWKNGEFYFDDADAQTIVKELERWYPVSIEINNENDQHKKISGRIKRSSSLKEVVDMLSFFGIHIRIQQNHKI